MYGCIGDHKSFGSIMADKYIVCASVEYNGEDTDVVESDLGVFHITLTKGQPKPERSYPEDETFPTVEVCSTATLVTRIWPFWPDL